MSFSRDDMTAYEKQPQTVVADNIPPGEIKATAAVTDASSAANADAASVDTPSGDEGESGDPTVTGDGTSDENADSSTATADPGSDSETTQEPVTKQAPKKGSAAERIQELLDLTEGYKEYGKLREKEAAEARAEIARLKASSGASTPKASNTEVPAAAADPDEPMPDLSDPDVNFDTDKLRAKTQKWVKDQIKAGTHQAVTAISGQTAAQKLEADVNAKVVTFAETHKDWETVVAKNQVLFDNQLSQPASLVLAQSKHTAELLYAFGKDEALTIRVAKLPPAQQLVEIGKLEAKIEAEKAAAPVGNQNPVTGAKPVKQKSLTQAPPPPTPTRAAGRATEREETDPNVSMDDFARRHREKKQIGRQTMRKARGLVE